MPSDRKQMNVRLDDEMKALFEQLLPLASEATGLAVSQSDVVRLALKSLAREYKAKAAAEKKKGGAK